MRNDRVNVGGSAASGGGMVNGERWKWDRRSKATRLTLGVPPPGAAEWWWAIGE